MPKLRKAVPVKASFFVDLEAIIAALYDPKKKNGSVQ